MLKLKSVQAGWNNVVNEQGTVVASLIKTDGIIVVDHIATETNDDDTITPTDANGNDLKTFKQGLEWVNEYFNN